MKTRGDWTLRQLTLMGLLMRQPGMGLKEYAEILGVTKQAVHLMLYRLGAFGLIDIEARELTKAGHKTVREAVATVEAAISSAA